VYGSLRGKLFGKKLFPAPLSKTFDHFTDMALKKVRLVIINRGYYSSVAASRATFPHKGRTTNSLFLSIDGKTVLT